MRPIFIIGPSDSGVLEARYTLIPISIAWIWGSVHAWSAVREDPGPIPLMGYAIAALVILCSNVFLLAFTIDGFISNERITSSTNEFVIELFWGNFRIKKPVILKRSEIQRVCLEKVAVGRYGRTARVVAFYCNNGRREETSTDLREKTADSLLEFLANERAPVITVDEKITT